MQCACCIASLQQHFTPIVVAQISLATLVAFVFYLNQLLQWLTDK